MKVNHGQGDNEVSCLIKDANYKFTQLIKREEKILIKKILCYYYYKLEGKQNLHQNQVLNQHFDHFNLPD